MNFSLKKGLAFILAAVLCISAPFAAFAKEAFMQVPAQTLTTEASTKAPAEASTETPTEGPTEAPAEAPAEAPDEDPAEAPTGAPTEAPTEIPAEASAPVEEEENLVNAASLNPDFTSNFAQALWDTIVFSATQAEEEVGLGLLGKGSIVKVKQRAGDRWLILADTKNGEVEGYAAANALRLLSEEETAAYQAAPQKADYSPFMAMQNPIGIMPAFFPGSTALTTGQQTTLNLQAFAGVFGTAYGHYTMAEAGQLTITFKSMGIAAGNLTLEVRSADQDASSAALWTGSLVPSGTTNFSFFVEAGAYDVIVSKSSPDDASAYAVGVTPSFILTGELGYRNNTMNNAAAFPLNGASPSVGIYSLQDSLFGRSDYYRLELPSAGMLTLSATKMTGGTMRFYMYGNDTSTNNVLADMSITLSGAQSENNSLTGHSSGWLDQGVYYIVVDGTASGRYRLHATLDTVSLTEIEPNDTPSLAYANGSRIALNSGTSIQAMLSKSDTVDYFYFHLPMDSRVSFSVKAQFSSADIAVCDVNGGTITSFGASGTFGAYGNPYEHELRGYPLPAGNYYLRVRQSNGPGTTTGLYSVRGTTEFTITGVSTVLTASTSGVYNVLTVTGATSGPRMPTYHRVNVFRAVPGGTPVLVDWRESKTAAWSASMTFTLNQTGDYLIQYVSNEGATWLDDWRTISVTVPATPPAQVFQVSNLSAVGNASGQIECTATVSGTNAITSMVFSLYQNNVLLDRYHGTNQTTHVFQAPASGDYIVQYAVTNGSTWVDGWAAVRGVTVPPIPPAQAFQVWSLSAAGNANGQINCTAVVVGTASIKDMVFSLYRNNVLLDRYYGTGKQSHTFQAPATGTYIVQYAVTNGSTWVDGWATVDVSVPPAQVFRVTDLSAVPNNTNGKIECTAVVAGVPQDMAFSLYRNNVLLDRYYGKGQTAHTFQVSSSGTYIVQYAVTNGSTWVDAWQAVTVSLPIPLLSINWTIADSAGGYVICESSVYHEKPIVSASYRLYDVNGVSKYLWQWPGSGDPLKHIFNIGDDSVHSVRFIISDGITTVESWYYF